MLRTNQQGFSAILLVMIVAGVALTAGYLMQRKVTFQSKEIKHSTNVLSLELIAKSIKGHTDCGTTMAAVAACAGPVALLKSDGTELIAAAGTAIEGWTLKAECANDTLAVSAARVTDGGFVKHPLTAKPLDWSANLLGKPQGFTGNLINVDEGFCGTAAGDPAPAPGDGSEYSIVEFKSYAGTPTGNPCDEKPFVAGESDACPEGTKAISGSVQCFHDGGGSDHPSLTASYPDVVNNTWRGECCGALDVTITVVCE